MPRGEIAAGQIPFADCPGDFIAEEKLDGTQIGIKFDDDLSIKIQSRGHYVDLSDHEFQPLASWIDVRQDMLFDRLGTTRTLFAEWLYLKHTVFYDRLPSFLMEFDVYDADKNSFLDTPGRCQLWAGSDIHSVPVITVQPLRDAIAARSHILRSCYRSPGWRETLKQVAIHRGQDPALALAQTDPTDYSEGLYLKQERDGRVVGRYKFVRAEFVDLIVASGTHWSSRAAIPNQEIAA